MRPSAALVGVVLGLSLLVVQPAQGTPGAADNYPRWRDVSAETGSAAVPARTQHGLATDPAGNAYLYGGAGADRVFLDDLWYLPLGGKWEQVSAGGQPPPPLVEPHLAVDARGDVWLFGGLAATGQVMASFYRFDAGARSWTDLTPSTWDAGIAARQDHGWELDPVSGDLYLFGGIGGTTGTRLLNDFWRYDVDAGRWEELSAGSGSDAISPRELYDVSADGRGGLYLFGGVGPWGVLNDFWRYDAGDATWRDLTAATGAATVPGRHYYGQACDADGDFYVLGGYAPAIEGAIVLGDFWRYDADARSWSQIAYPGQGGVLPRIPYVLAYQGATDSLLTFGGADPTGRALNDAWVLELGHPPPTATPRPSTPSPTAEPTATPTPFPRVLIPLAH